MAIMAKQQAFMFHRLFESELMVHGQLSAAGMAAQVTIIFLLQIISHHLPAVHTDLPVISLFTPEVILNPLTNSA